MSKMFAYGLAWLAAGTVLAVDVPKTTVLTDDDEAAICAILAKQTFDLPAIDRENYGRGSAVPSGKDYFGWTRDPLESGMAGVALLGYLPYVSSKEIASSILSVGLERSNCMGDALYPALGAAGVKQARVWVSWRAVEKSRGVYDFTALDRQVDQLLDNGISPWFYVCYGNPAVYYPEVKGGSAEWDSPWYHGADAMRAWHAFVAATAERYGGKVARWEVWNELEARWYRNGEPAQKTLGVGQSAKDFVDFLRQTAPVIRSAIPEAKIGVSLCSLSSPWIPALGDAGAGEVLDAWIYHGYRRTPEELVESAIARARACVKRPDGKPLELWQGESGRATGESGRFHLHTEFGQAKFVARRYFKDAAMGVTLSNVFNAADPRYGYFKEASKSPKLAYHTLAAMGFLLDGLERAPDLQMQLTTNGRMSVSPQLLWLAAETHCFRRKGVPLFVWWLPEHPDIETEPLFGRLSLHLGYRERDNLRHPVVIDPIRRRVWNAAGLRWKDAPGVDLIRPIWACTYPLIVTDISVFADFTHKGR